MRFRHIDEIDHEFNDQDYKEYVLHGVTLAGEGGYIYEFEYSMCWKGHKHIPLPAVPVKGTICRFYLGDPDEGSSLRSVRGFAVGGWVLQYRSMTEIEEKRQADKRWQEQFNTRLNKLIEEADQVEVASDYKEAVERWKAHGKVHIGYGLADSLLSTNLAWDLAFRILKVSSQVKSSANAIDAAVFDIRMLSSNSGIERTEEIVQWATNIARIISDDGYKESLEKARKHGNKVILLDYELLVDPRILNNLRPI
jgi:CheY-like chemotaxis protein